MCNDSDYDDNDEDEEYPEHGKETYEEDLPDDVDRDHYEEDPPGDDRDEPEERDTQDETRDEEEYHGCECRYRCGCRARVTRGNSVCGECEHGSCQADDPEYTGQRDDEDPHF